MDSRITSWILAGLRNKMGKDWLGDVHFRCHGYEGSVFKEVMMKQGWKNEQYSVYKDGREKQLDYYNIGEFGVDINAFHEPTVDFFDDLTREMSEKQIALVSGVCGGEIFCYPLQSQRRFTDNRFQDLLHNIQEIRNRFCKEYNRWGDILAPYLGYEYLDLAFRVPNKNFKLIALNGQEVDLMRASMTNIFNDRIPFCIGHRYNMRISEARAGYMKEKYTGSKFYRHFSHLSVVKKAQPWIAYQNLPEHLDKEPSSIDLKLYGYATMYERTTRK
jgi:hypothetical protein